MRKHPNTIGETFIQFDKANNTVIGVKKLSEDNYERIEREVGKRDKQEVIKEVTAELAKVEVE